MLRIFPLFLFIEWKHILTLFKLLLQPDLSKLVIVRVVVETKENLELPNERLKSGNAIFYIWYKNKGRVCKVHGFKPPRDRIAMVRRNMDENTGLFFLTMLDGNPT